ncbi:MULTISPECIES: ribonuclease III [Komagataeibacter]|mgnify:FL=1|uniref:Ribonuclease 3 n=1 Tax=Komagataeibacter saccharivorans TaxID=265959 RepID=A0A347W8X5_9PROT|nr:ribonuclease III [Komagataeibacter saccharivorans]AXY21318.1 Ribonuclease 3 [Komagataeibacter saccharivorans]PYD51298.1 ribonuclease III [Komagataeibacter saccharivorans]QBL94787.1 Ribonuclease 3 [Komagataeibacter saccharivorans]GBQ37740.1 ribonuclease III [Komagataeibacter saccharivorans NRIC 0614]
MQAAGVPAAEIKRLEGCLGYHFTRPELLLRALTHRSAAHERNGGRRARQGTAQRGAGSNERLEFIGDRVLGLLMAEWLLERFPDEQEGALGPRHAHLVSRTVLARIAQDMGLHSALDVAEHEARAGVRQTANVLADAVEAILGAIYLDGGLDPARGFVRRVWNESIVAQARPPKDPKTALQEWVLARALPLPQYRVVSSDGPSHAPRFVIAVDAQGKTGQGVAGSKRAAESDAASDLLRQLGADRQANASTHRKGHE